MARAVALPAERPRQPVLPGVAQVRDGDVERVGDPAAALLGGAGRAGARRARRRGGRRRWCRGSRPAGRAGGRAARAPGRAAADLARRAATGSRRTGRRPASRRPPSRSRARVAPHRHLGERDREAAAGHVLGARDEAPRDRLADERLDGGSRSRSSGGGPSSGATPASRSYSQPARPGVSRRRAGSRRPRRGTPGRRASRRRRAARRPRSRASGRWPAARRLVVQRDVAAGDGQAQRAARVAQAADRLASCQNASGRVGSPKLRQFVTPSGRAPVIATLRAASATDIAAPSHGSGWPTGALPSVVATSAFVVPLMRSTAAPRPGPGDRVGLDGRVVLLEDRAARCEVRRSEQRREHGARVHARARGSWSTGSAAAPGAGAARRRAGGAARARRRSPPTRGRGRGCGRARAPRGVVAPAAVDDRELDDVGSSVTRPITAHGRSQRSQTARRRPSGPARRSRPSAPGTR